ncbi:molybdopterin cofactor-binding domain-containing protein [Micromonospora sp. NPDC051227]|uniref:molybdopterin cofactor-binding domain-containing protein n=1 Tax=Micromonospora sp. NPDC051227 TaxID=3364285 RepID=UPI0037928888
MEDENMEPVAASSANAYACAHVANRDRQRRLNIPCPGSMRAPAEAQANFALESALDELSYQLGIDFLDLRLHNYAEVSRAATPWPRSDATGPASESVPCPSPSINSSRPAANRPNSECDVVPARTRHARFLRRRTAPATPPDTEAAEACRSVGAVPTGLASVAHVPWTLDRQTRSHRAITTHRFRSCARLVRKATDSTCQPRTTTGSRR